LRLPVAPLQIGIVFCGLRAMEAWWIVVLADGDAPALFLGVLLCLFRVCVLFRKTRRWQLSEVAIRFSFLAFILVEHLVSWKGVWSCVSDRSHGIRSAVVFGGSTWIQSSFVYARVSSVWNLPIYASLHRWWWLFWCAGSIGP
jgi:hypothetical protein